MFKGSSAAGPRPSAATEPDGQRYNYSVRSSGWRQGKGDVLADFLASTAKRGIGAGFYYSLNSNQYAQRRNWSAAELMAVEKQQLVELWGQYGRRGLTELWFDGGFEGAMQPFVQAKLAAGVLYTSAYVARHSARVRGALTAVLRPTSLASLIREHGFNETLFHECVEGLKLEGRLPGSVQGSDAEEDPDIAKAMKSPLPRPSSFAASLARYASTYFLSSKIFL